MSSARHRVLLKIASQVQAFVIDRGADDYDEVNTGRDKAVVRCVVVSRVDFLFQLPGIHGGVVDFHLRESNVHRERRALQAEE